MERFEWAEENLGAVSPHRLQEQGVQVYFAPNVAAGKVVNLADGGIKTFAADERRPEAGYYAGLDSLGRYCVKKGLPFVETNGRVSTVPAGHGEAGDPLLHGGERQEAPTPPSPRTIRRR